MKTNITKRIITQIEQNTVQDKKDMINISGNDFCYSYPGEQKEYVLKEFQKIEKNKNYSVPKSRYDDRSKNLQKLVLYLKNLNDKKKVLQYLSTKRKNNQAILFSELLKKLFPEITKEALKKQVENLLFCFFGIEKVIIDIILDNPNLLN